jgi:tetratricopeptide (TPR) repeat protein
MMNLSAITEAERILIAIKQHVANEKIADAVDMLNNLIASYPEYSKAYVLLAEIYSQRLQDEELAEAFLKKAISLNEPYTEAYLNYAALILRQEKFAETLATLNKAIEIKGIAKDKVYDLFGRLYEMQGKLDEAIGYYKKCITASLSNTMVEDAEHSLKRCETKKKYL